MIIKFYKIGHRWFADLPDYIAQGGLLGDCEMVCGADTMLDVMSQGEETVHLRMETSNSTLSDCLTLVEICDERHDVELIGGAYYHFNEYCGIEYNFNIWLCSVTTFVFGEFPKKIFIKVLG